MRQVVGPNSLLGVNTEPDTTILCDIGFQQEELHGLVLLSVNTRPYRLASAKDLTVMHQLKCPL